jgi:uncharacterized repeat protein (TIGR03803 family)
MDASGNLYGTTFAGGANGYGTVFELVYSSGSYAEKVLYSFSNYYFLNGRDLNIDGGDPYAGLIMDASGNLYGTTSSLGLGGSGTVFELVNSSGTYSEVPLLTFGTSCGTGNNSQAGLIMDSSGNLYGTTTSGGANGAGTVFEVSHISGPAGATATTLSSSSNPATAGEPLTLTATVTSAIGIVAGGTVSFSSASTPLGNADVVCGSATLAIEGAEALGIGTSSVMAQFNPANPTNPGLSPSSGTLSQTVNEAGVVLTSGNNTLTGNDTINGTVSATSFVGNGAGLTGITAASANGLSCTGCVGNAQLGVSYALGDSQGGNALNALALNGLSASAFQPAGSYAGLGANIFTGVQTFTASLSAAAGLVLPSTGVANATQAYNSNPLDAAASVFNSATQTVQNPLFRWQAEPVASSNNTGSPTATLNLLFGPNGTPAETGLSVNANGTINFATGQTFPGSSGSGTITGVTAGTGLSGGGTSGSVTLSNAGVLSLTAGTGLSSTGGQTPTVNLNTTFTDGRYLQLSGGTLTGSLAAPSFSGNGSALTNLNPANLSVGTAAINISGTALTATTAGSLSGTIAESQVTGLATALSNLVPTSAVGRANGVASLDATGKVPTSELPSTGGGIPAILTGWCSGAVSSTNGATFSFAGMGTGADGGCSNGVGPSTAVGIPVTSAGMLANLHVYPGTAGNGGTSLAFTVYKAAAPGWTASTSANQTTISALSFTHSNDHVTLTVASAANFAAGNTISVSGITGTYNAGTNCTALAGSSFDGSYTILSKTATTIVYLDSSLPTNCGSNISRAAASGTVADTTNPTLHSATRTTPTATALSCAIAAPSSSAAAVCADTTDSVAVNPGDVISVVATSARTSGTESIGDIRVSLEKQ